MKLLDPDTAVDAGALVVANTENVLELAERVQAAGLVVLHFPKWTDGRAYSQAVLLRARLGFRGEIRATGDVVVDMLPLLQRCGFDSAQLRAGQNRETALKTLGRFPGHYQGDAVGGRPLFAGLAA